MDDSPDTLDSQAWEEWSSKSLQYLLQNLDVAVEILKATYHGIIRIQTHLNKTPYPKDENSPKHIALKKLIKEFEAFHQWRVAVSIALKEKARSQS
jgi:hypothetical protein